VLRLRKQLTEQGLDARADTIGWHLRHHHAMTLSRATIHRILPRAGAVVPDPGKRQRSSYLRFAAELPNECWQSDFTHYRLTTLSDRPGEDVEVISWLDDHSRYALSVTAHVRITGPIVVASFRETVAQYGIPASTLTDIQSGWAVLQPGCDGRRDRPEGDEQDRRPRHRPAHVRARGGQGHR
jgi:transposase InsO family protein